VSIVAAVVVVVSVVLLFALTLAASAVTGEAFNNTDIANVAAKSFKAFLFFMVYLQINLNIFSLSSINFCSIEPFLV
jgi:hypothetical protein